MSKFNLQSHPIRNLDTEVTIKLITAATEIIYDRRPIIPLIITFIGIPILKEIDELETPGLLFIGDKATVLKERIKGYLSSIFKHIIDNNGRENKITDVEFASTIDDSADEIIDTIFNVKNVEEFRTILRKIRTSGRNKIPLVESFDDNQIEPEDVLSCIRAYSQTLKEIEHRVDILIRCLKRKGTNFNSDLILTRDLVNSNRKGIDYTVLTGTINDLITKSQNPQQDETCTITFTRVFIKHQNCDKNQGSGNELISEIQIPEFSFHEIDVCKITPQSINDKTWNDIEIQRIEIDDIPEGYRIPKSFTTSMVTTLQPSKYDDEHSMAHPGSLFFGRDISIKTGSECDILIKYETKECDIKIKTVKKITKGEQSINMYYGVIQSIDKFRDKYEALLSASELSKLDSKREEIYSFLRIWEQSKE